jgi:cytochrome c-type biogenesis protein CcmF
VHFGMILVVAGLIGSNVYKHEATALVKVKAGQTASIAGYTLTYKGMTGNTGPQSSTRSFATFAVTRGGTQIGTLAPHTDVYPASGAAVRAVIIGRPFEDLFVVADDPFDSTSKSIALRMIIFPLVRWVWIGSILLCVGAAVSLWPKARRQEQEARAAVPAADADGRLDAASA